MSDYDYYIDKNCREQPCAATRSQSVHNHTSFICTDHRNIIVLENLDKMIEPGGEGLDALFSVIEALAERILILEGVLPR